MSNPFESLFGPPPAPEERLAQAKKNQARWESALAQTKRVREELHQFSAMGFGDRAGHVEEALKHMAILQDDLETALLWPVDP